MKKLTLFAACALLCITAAGWGRKGHATIARIAETHLTKTAKKNIDAVMHGESICGYASYADENKSTLLVDLGGKMGALPHTFEANSDCEPFRGIDDNGRYVKNCIYFIEKFSEELKNWKALDDSTAFANLVLIVHFVGDMHCPAHIRFYPDDMTIGKFDVVFRGEKQRYHTLWDTGFIELKYPWSFGDLAHILDCASPEQIAEICKGGPYDWGRDAAQCCRSTHDVKPGDTISSKWYHANLPLLQNQLRKAGYRLAHQLNMTFDPAYARRHRR